MNISLNGTAAFNCTATATFINWEANGKPVDEALKNKGFVEGALITIDEEENLRTKTLRVVGLNDNNNVTILCVATLTNIQTTDSTVAESEPALILVQGNDQQ